MRECEVPPVTEKNVVISNGSDARGGLRHGVELLLGALAYFLLAKAGLALASIHPSASPIWPPTGFALGIMLLRGVRLAPAILLGAFAANAITAGSLATAGAIAVGNMLEGAVGATLIRRWSGGPATFDTTAGVVAFALASVAATMISATIGAGSLALAGYAAWDRFADIWLTWWMGDFAGALLIAPVIVLWARQGVPRGAALTESAGVFAGAIGVGLVAFSPLLAQTANRSALAFLAIAPLMWAALRRNQRDTATAALLLSCFAVWGTAADGGPFARASLNESFLLVVMFMISAAVPSLALSADAAARRRAEHDLEQARTELERKVDLGTQALSDSERQFALLVDSVTDQAIYRLDPAGRVTSWNNGARRIKGYAAEEIIGRHFGDFYSGEDRRRGEPERALELAASVGKYEAEGWRVRRDGSRFWASTVIEPIRDEKGVLIGFAKITRDISLEREAALALERTREELAQAQKMEALGQLTGSIAHDFNNLLMIVNGYAQMLERRVSDPKAAAGIEAIRIAAARGESLTRRLLAFSRRQKLSPSVVSLRERIEAAREMLTSSLREDVKLDYDIASDLWPVEIDVAELDLALVNIAVNARDAMPDGGTLTISARNAQLTAGEAGRTAGEARRTEGEAGVDDFVALALRDTGTGIAPDILAKVFEPFFTTKPKDKGTGLGLSQVYGFAHQSGGSVKAESRPGAGTTITIYLPRSHARLSAATEPVSAAAVPGHGTVLVVEDNPHVADVTSELLEHLGYRTLRAENASEALKTLERNDEIHLVFSDIVMPGMNGIALAREIVKRHPALPVLLTTGYSETLQAGPTEFAILRKPFELPALERAVRGALRPSPSP
jgi:PAS domain S-box-containing protein